MKLTLRCLSFPASQQLENALSARANYRVASPETYRSFVAIHKQLSACGLEPTLLPLIYLRVSQMNGCAYCVDLHSREALDAGVCEQKLHHLITSAESPLFSERERAAIAWAECLTLVAQTHAPDDAYERVSRQFNDKQLADLIYAIGLANAFNRFGIGFRQMPDSPDASSRARAGLKTVTLRRDDT